MVHIISIGWPWTREKVQVAGPGRVEVLRSLIYFINDTLFILTLLALPVASASIICPPRRPILPTKKLRLRTTASGDWSG